MYYEFVFIFIKRKNKRTMKVDDENETMEAFLHYYMYLSKGKAASEAINFNDINVLNGV